MRRTVQAAVVVIGACLASLASGASAQLFDFESASATYADPPGGARPGALTSLSLTNGGLTLTFTRPSSAFDIVDNTGGQAGKPAGWGVHSLDPFFAETSATPFVLDFSSPVSFVSFEYGDYGQDSDTGSVQAFSGPGGTGALLDSASDAYGLSTFPTVGTLSVSGAGIQSIVFIGGAAGFPHSVFYDNFLVRGSAAVPEPGAAAGLIAACMALGGTAFARKTRRGRA